MINKKYGCNLCISLGIIDVTGLKNYLLENNYPFVVMLVEDGTKILQQVQYDARTDSLTGCVSPLNENGIPVQGLFEAGDAYAVANYLEDYKLADTAYVQLALPLAIGAAPFVIYYAGTDNTFRSNDVVNRWMYTEKLLATEGIVVTGYSSDGDPKLLSAMMSRTKFLSRMEISRWGQWFITSNDREPIYVQDAVHLINKIRNRVLKNDMKIGMLNRFMELFHNCNSKFSFYERKFQNH